MVCLGKHVNRLYFNELIVSDYQGNIPCHGGRVAGNINNPFRGQCQDLGKNILVHSSPRRVDDKGIRLPGDRGEFLLDIPADKVAVIDPVSRTVFSGILNRALADLHAGDGLGFVGQEDWDGAGSAVKIKNRFIVIDFSIVEHGLVKSLCSQRIGLKKGI